MGHQSRLGHMGHGSELLRSLHQSMAIMISVITRFIQKCYIEIAHLKEKISKVQY